MRFIALKNINRQLSWLLPLINLSSTHPHSLGTRLSSVGSYLFYDVKTMFLHSVLNSATRRSLDQAPPEIKMDPLENVGGKARSHSDSFLQLIIVYYRTHSCAVRRLVPILFFKNSFLCHIVRPFVFIVHS